MSDIFLAAGISVDIESISRRLRWTPRTRVWKGTSEGSLVWAMARVDDETHWGPAWDSASRTRVLLEGRFALEEAEWKEAEGLPYEGGLAARLILARWLRGGAGAIETFNGSGAAIVIDERTGHVHLWTDRLGFYPVFGWSGPGLLIGSHADVAADALAKAGHPCALDPVTMAEFLRTGTATQPHTYWCGIDQLDAGTYFRYSYGTTPRCEETRQYWRPAYFDRPYLEDRREIVERLAIALTSSVRKRTLQRLGKVAVLLSSGADSRVALFAASDPGAVTCFTAFDEPNEELAGAQTLAAAVGAKHVAHQRGMDEYIEHALDAVRLSGGMWSIESAHYGGLLPQLDALSPGVVLTGCYADYLLKGVAYNRTAYQIAGRPVPLYRLAAHDHNFHHPYFELAPKWQARVGDRLNARYAASARGGDKAASMVEYLRVSPISREVDTSGRLYLRRMTPHDIYMADTDVLELFGLMHPREKVSGIPFGMAVSRLSGSFGCDVLNNNFSAPVGAQEWHRLAAFIQASVMRKIAGKGSGQPFETDPQSVATAGSWPYFPRVIKFSTRLKDWRASMPKEQEELLFDIVGHGRRSWSIDTWADREPSHLLRLYSASLWLAENPSAIGSHPA